ncbi:oxygenase MpaB family protein [Streptomyces sp. NPDC055055]
MRQDADGGLFGPGSVTWQVHSDPVMWIAGVRALWLQALHPVAVRGVMINSGFREDPWGRLMRTAGFVGTLSYGTVEDAERAGARVRRIHRLLGVDDPELLRWVHCAETDSYLSVARRSGLPLTEAQADRYVDEHRTSARMVGLDPEGVPASAAELAAYFASVRPGLAAGPDARTVEDFLRRPPVKPVLVPAREVIWRRVAALAYDTLPPYAHALYGRPAPPEETVTHRLVATANLLRCVPARVRWRLPPRHVLRAVERLGPRTRPDPYVYLGPDTYPTPYPLSEPASILEEPRAANGSDGGGGTRWGTPD